MTDGTPHPSRLAPARLDGRNPAQFAYRCLPLNIANAHGWEVGAAITCAARWNGGTGVDAVEVWTEPGAPAHRGPVSLFGQSVLTFHIEGIMRTPLGWNLWVGGPPNSSKDGIAPLPGLIETDWLPFTFTMNWRFTRAGEWVRFDRGEAIAFFSRFSAAASKPSRHASLPSTATPIWPAGSLTGTPHARTFTGRGLTHRRRGHRAHGRSSIIVVRTQPDAREKRTTRLNCTSGTSATAKYRQWTSPHPTQLCCRSSPPPFDE